MLKILSAKNCSIWWIPKELESYHSLLSSNSSRVGHYLIEDIDRRITRSHCSELLLKHDRQLPEIVDYPKFRALFEVMKKDKHERLVKRAKSMQ